MTSHSIEPELLQPVPRRVRIREGFPEMRPACLFALPFMVIGILWIRSAFSPITVQLKSRVVSGRVTGRYSTKDSEGTSYFVHYVYYFKGKEHTDTDYIDAEEYSHFAEGSSVNVWIPPPRADKDIHLILPGHSNFDIVDIVMSFIPVILWNGVTFGLLCFLYVDLRLHRFLTERGLATIGRITEKEVDYGSDSTTYQITYEYSPDYNAVGKSPESKASTITRRIPVSEKEYSKIEPGSDVTVLYAPKRPARSVLYLHSHYQVISDGNINV